MRKVNFVWAAVLTFALGAGLFGLNHQIRSKQSSLRALAVGEEEADGPMQAQRWRALAWKDATGYIRPDGLVRAMRQRAETLSASAARPLITTGSTLTWTNLGPTNISGRGRSILVDPTNSNRILEGSVGGGIWKSTDGGTTFTPVNDSMSNLAICSMARDPQIPTTIYAGTGEGYFNADQIQGNGLYKSIDNGDTWNQLPGTEINGFINRVAVSPGNSSNILIAGSKGLYRSTDGGSTFANTFGSKNANGTFIAFNPSDGSKAVATVMDYNFSVADWVHTAYFSTDGGQTWTPTAGPLSQNLGFSNRIELAYAPSNPTIVYATNPLDRSFYKSTDGGQSYVKMTSSGALDFNGQGWYDNCIAVSPTDPNFVVAGGLNIFRSTNGGQTISTISDWTTYLPHADVHALVFDPGYNGTTNKALYTYTDGGTFKTPDVTTVNSSNGWQALDKAVTLQLYGIAGDAASNLFIGGAQDNGTPVINGSGPATKIFGGDGGYVAMDPTDSGYQYGEYVYLTLFRRVPGTSGGEYIYNGISDASSSNANFIAPFILDPNDPNKIWAGGSQLWLSTNAKAATPTFTSVRAAGTDYISAIAVAPGNSNVVWVGQNDGVVSKTTNGLAGTPTWTNVTNTAVGADQFSKYFITRIYIDPADSNTVYVARGGFQSNNVWKTTNGGVTWASVSGSGSTGLPQAPVRGFTRDPKDAMSLFAGTEVGVFWSHDGGNTWLTSNVAPSNVSVDELTWANNGHVLLAATHGRGFWKAEFSTVVAPSLASFTISPTTAPGGTSATGTVTLGSAAPGGGVKVTLSSNTTGVSAPSSVTVAEGSTSATFTITTAPVATSTKATLTATLGTVSKTAQLTVTPPAVSAVSVSPSTVVGGSSSIVAFYVTLSSPAPSGGLLVALSSSSPSVATIPSSLRIAAGTTTASVRVTTVAVGSNTSVTLTATSVGGGPQSAILNLTPAGLDSLTFSPTSVPGGNSTIGTVTLKAPAPNGGATVTLSSNSVSGSVPGSVTVASGTTSATFSASTTPVTVNTPVTVTATLGSSSKTGQFTVQILSLSSVSVSPSTFVGGGPGVVAFYVNLASLAPSGGFLVALTSSNTSVATMPSSLRIAAGTVRGSVRVTTVAVNSSITVTLSATSTKGGVPLTASLTLVPAGPPGPRVSSVRVSPTTVTGRNGALRHLPTFYVTLDSPAPSGGFLVALTSSNYDVALIQSSLRFAAGSTVASCSVVPLSVSKNTLVTLSAQSKSAGLIVTP